MPQALTTETITDWDNYYKSVPSTAKLTRKYTTSVLIDLLTRYRGKHHKIVEIGGANSCFLDSILQAVQPSHYTVIDNNAYGLSLLRTRGISEQVLSLQNGDVLNLPSDEDADIVFSVGLIEHFNRSGTQRAIEAHFRLLKPGGYAIISFPTPTLLYRVARRVCEQVGVWKFFDERPLQRNEVAQTMCETGSIVEEKLLWPLILTQRIIVVQKPPLIPDLPCTCT